MADQISMVRNRVQRPQHQKVDTTNPNPTKTAQAQALQDAVLLNITQAAYSVLEPSVEKGGTEKRVHSMHSVGWCRMDGHTTLMPTRQAAHPAANIATCTHRCPPIADI